MSEQNLTPTRMRAEIDEIPQAAARLIGGSKQMLARIDEAVRVQAPRFLATIARGSSDHAAGFLKYAVELESGLPVASIGPSVASIYQRQMRMAHSVTLAISQSGKSPDIVAMAQNVRRGGSLVIALTNAAGSPLAAAANVTLDLLAGPEVSVAATKTFVNSAIGGLLILAESTESAALRRALAGLPEKLAEAVALDWSELHQALDGKSSLYILGRGPSLPIAGEAALKFKETCGLHAEAFSAAEVMHGPVSIVGKGFPVLALCAGDASEEHVAAVADQLAGQGASVFALTDKVSAARTLPRVRTGHGLTDALVQIATFYGFVEAQSRRLGLDPDHPRHLRKVTETI
jgi:glucosamine--fructose-6-phosphate aminotransferase (isomerizing)